MRVSISGVASFALALLAMSAVSVPAAQACTADDFGKAVDDAGAQLRAYNAEAAPKLNAKLKQLGSRKSWKDSEVEERALSFLTDEKIAGFDATADELLTKIDTLGRVPAGGAPDCAKLDELKAASLELLAVMKAKTGYSIARIDSELAGSAPATPPPVAEAPTSPAAASPAPAAATATAEGKAEKNAEKGADKLAAVPTATPPAAAVEKAEPVPGKPTAAPPKPPAPPAAAAKPPTTAPHWTTTTEQAALDDAYKPPQSGPAPASPPPASPPPGALLPPEEGYTIDEIREASRGFFGTISTSLGSVIEHAFSQSGRPSAYVLGTEGGGAFLAGLRYGEGTLYLRAGGTRKVYWHGPSLGYDIGAAGSRTLFLIYGLKDANAIFRHYAGIDGSAYVVGGFGITYLQGGGVIMAPIRSGLGLRVGANIGYIRFTPEASWNPF